jgi:8-amino-7-oxononanoate synthase
MTDRLASRVAARLRSLGDAGLRRRLSPPAGVDLSSNDYLGLAHDPRVVRAFADAVSREGCGSTGSRLLRGDREAFHDVERRFAAFKHAGAALYFSSGYLANLAVLTTLTERGDVILSDERNHASLIDGVRLSSADRVVFPHNDIGAVAARLDEAANSGRHTFVVVESVFSMDGDVAPLADYAAICDTHGATLVVDEAHAVGLFGEGGSGVIEAAGLSHEACVSINSAGKALGVGGAFVAGPAWAIEYLVQRARPFVFSTAAPPAVAGAIQASLDVVAGEPDRRTRARQRSRYARAALANVGIAVPEGETPIVPILIGANDEAVRIAETLQADGFDIRAIRPPTVPDGTSRLRLSVNVDLDEATLDAFVGALARVFAGRTSWPVVSS